MLHELAPLAEEAIDVDKIDVPDLDTLQSAMNRAVERLNMPGFIPRAAREYAVTALRLVIEAITDGETGLAGANPRLRSTRSGRRQVRGSRRLHRRRARPARRVAQRLRPQRAWWAGPASPPSLRALGRRTRRHRRPRPSQQRPSVPILGQLITRQGGRHVVYGSALAPAATMHAWSPHAGTPITELTHAKIR